VHGPNTTDLSGTNSALCQSLAIWLGFLFLYLFSARYTLLARYRPVLSSCVRLSVCPSATSRYCIGTTGRIELVSAWWLPSTNPTLRCTEIWVSPKIRVFPSGTLSQTPDFENFATTSRSRCQQHSSSSSTVELVDDAYTSVDELWLFTASRSTVTLSLHYCDLLWTCFTTRFYS